MSWWVKLGLAFYAFVGLLYSLGGMFVRYMGPCPAFSSNTDCYWSPAKEMWLFPGSQLTVIGVGIVLFIVARRLATR
jgi:hypothetical protein